MFLNINTYFDMHVRYSTTESVQLETLRFRAGRFVIELSANDTIAGLCKTVLQNSFQTKTVATQ